MILISDLPMNCIITLFTFTHLVNRPIPELDLVRKKITGGVVCCVRIAIHERDHFFS